MTGFKTLDEMLTATYGPGNYLTPSRLRKDGGIIITPNAPLYNVFADAANRPATDGIWTPDKIERGDTSLSIGHFPITGQLMPRGYDGVFLYGTVLKKAGEENYRVPPEFPELAFPVQGFADYVSATTKNPIDRVCAISLRVLPLKEGVRLIGDAWHIHKPIVLTDKFVERAHFFEVDDETLEAFSEVSPHMMQTEGYISNICPTRIQTEASAEPMQIFEGQTDYLIKSREAWPVQGRQPAPYELVVGSAATYHSACQIASHEVGQTRLLLVMSSMPTKKFEAEYGLG
jgi:hypothetical protein